MSIHLVAVGDVCLGGPVAAYDPAPGTLWSAISAADLAIANLECALTDCGVRADKPVTLRARPEVAAEVARLGFRAVTMATNHAMDYGVEGLDQTFEALDRHGVAHCGAGRDFAAAASPAALSAGSLRVGLLAFASTCPPGFAATDSRPGIAPLRVTTQFVVDGELIDEQPGSAPFVTTRLLESDVEAALAQVERAHREYDLVVVGLHWGVMPLWNAPIQGPLADYQRPLAHRLIEAGADLIIGGHPHVPHGVEVYRGKPILYSLGNFIFHRLPEAAWDLRRPGPVYPGAEARVLDMSFSSGIMLRAAVGRHHVEGVELIPYRLNPQAEPVISRGEEARAVLEIVRATSPVQEHFVIDGEIGRVEPSLLAAPAGAM